jgi:hypothetical protein
LARIGFLSAAFLVLLLDKVFVVAVAEGFSQFMTELIGLMGDGKRRGCRKNDEHRQ